MTETFRYDNLDRLDTVLFNNTVSEMVYDAYGRMLKKTSEGDVVFRQALYNNQSKPHAVRWAETNDAMFPDVPQSIAYTMHDKVKTIQQGDDALTIDYGYDRQRIGMTQQNSVLHSTSSKLYVGNCEYNHGELRAQRLTYLSGPMGVFAVYEELGPLYKGGSEDADNDGAVGDSLTDGGYTGALYYLHRDHLGSVTTITNASGAIVQELSYDAWGNLRNPTTWSGSFTGTPKFDRGYTGHEHLCTFGLINMNGRVYDPVMCCFLSVDTYVQDPGSPQNFNRYAYCLNNPLRYVDPSGEIAIVDDILVAALVCGVLNVTMNGINNVSNGEGFLKKCSSCGCYWRIGWSGGCWGCSFGAGAGLVGAIGGAVAGGASSVYNHSDFISGVLWGGLSGWIGGGIAQYIGGGLGAFVGGSLSDAVAQIPGCYNGNQFDYKHMVLSGGLSFAMYHGASYSNWKYRGGNKMGEVDVSYRQFCKMQTLFQRSRAWQREMGGYLMEDGSFKKVSDGTNCQIVFDKTPPDGAIAEFHTHWDKPGKIICFDENGNYISDPKQSRYVSRTSRYHGELDFTEGIKSLVLNRYDGSYFSGEYMMQNLPNDFIGPPNWVHSPYQVINPPVIRYNYGFIFSIRH